MLQLVWEKCVQATDKSQVLIATEDERIFEHCRKNGMDVLMTGDQHKTGTDRLCEVATKRPADVYINVQGDEPMVEPGDIRTVLEASKKDPATIYNAMCPITDERDFRSPNVPKVVARPDGRLLYMSRGAVPTSKAHDFQKAWKQVCIYAFPKDKLAAFGASQTKTPLEQIEDIEILRFLELGHDVMMLQVSGASIAVDTPENLEEVRRALSGR
jgi:3-deoxy-manno-octulosonate cytidylyltransferase (CMP-KDO synthetase)